MSGKARHIDESGRWRTEGAAYRVVIIQHVGHGEECGDNVANSWSSVWNQVQPSVEWDIEGTVSISTTEQRSWTCGRSTEKVRW